jgi:hypothetical protein
LFDIEILNNFLFSFQETNNDMKSREPSTWMTQWAALTSKSNKSPSNEMASPRSNPGKTNKIYDCHVLIMASLVARAESRMSMRI